MLEKVKAFHRAFGHPVNEKPVLPEQGEKHIFVAPGVPWNKVAEWLYDDAATYQSPRYLRMALLAEEFTEYLEAENEHDIVGIADALGDMLVIIGGTALTYGIKLDAVFDEIHRSNMSKLGEDGKPVLNSAGKITKGPNYVPPDVEAVL